MNTKCWDEVDKFVAAKLVPPDDALTHALHASAAAGLPSINVTAPQGRFLQLLVRLQGARHILEVGTLGGYSTIWMAQALPPDGTLVTLELDPDCATVAKSNFAFAGLGARVDLREGPALESLAQLATEDRPPFDFVFLDADKEHHPEYFQSALELSHPGTLIVADNVVRAGGILDADTDDPNLRGIRRLFDLIAEEPRVQATALQTVGSKGHDGFVLALVTPD